MNEIQLVLGILALVAVLIVAGRGDQLGTAWTVVTITIIAVAMVPLFVVVRQVNHCYVGALYLNATSVDGCYNTEAHQWLLVIAAALTLLALLLALLVNRRRPAAQPDNAEQESDKAGTEA